MKPLPLPVKQPSGPLPLMAIPAAKTEDIVMEILTNPGTRVEPITRGRFVGGARYVAPDGSKLTFANTGEFAYFGEY